MTGWRRAGSLVAVDAGQLREPCLHRLLQVVAGAAERGVAGGEIRLVFAAYLATEGAAAADVVEHQQQDAFDLAVKVGQRRIGADRLFDRPLRGGAIKTRL